VPRLNLLKPEAPGLDARVRSAVAGRCKPGGTGATLRDLLVVLFFFLFLFLFVVIVVVSDFGMFQHG
jgi:hypothetical protein